MPRAVVHAFVPGRVCLVGEHSDWAAERADASAIGRAVVACAREGVRAIARRVGDGCDDAHGTDAYADDARKTFAVVGVSGETYERDAEDVDGFLLDACEGGYWSYVAGAYARTYEYLARRGDETRASLAHGTRVRVVGCDLPIGKGLSSSAAICVLMVRCVALAHGVDLGIGTEMRLAYEGERATPSRCGRLDQVVAFGPEKCVEMTFAEPEPEVGEVIPSGEIYLVVCDLGAKKDTTKILKDLQRAYDDGDAELRAALGSRNQRHVADAIDAIKRGDAQALGSVYVAAQRTFDDAARHLCPEFEAPTLRSTLAAVDRDLSDTIWGSKGVGSQGDGAAQFVCRCAESASRLRAYLEARSDRFKTLEVILRPAARKV